MTCAPGKTQVISISPMVQVRLRSPKGFCTCQELDKRNGNTLWQDATRLELDQLDEYNTFKNLGHKAPAPTGYKKIRTHLVYDCKHDGWLKARMVADDHLTTVPIDSVYSTRVVSLRGLQMLVFLAELNDLQTWSMDIGNAYLEAETKERVLPFKSSRHSTDYAHLALVGMIDLLIASVIWDLHHPRQNRISGCDAMEMCTSI
jgi:hypothetical protein